MNKKLKGSQPDLSTKWPYTEKISAKISGTDSILSGLNGPVVIKDHKMGQRVFIRFKLLEILLLNIVILLSTAAFANNDGSRHYFEHGIAVTGLNDLCGSPVFSLPAPGSLPPTFHATTLGEYDPGGALPIPISPTNCNDDIVVTTNTDLNFLTAVGLPDIDSRLKNIPLREVPVISNPDGSRSAVPALESVPGNALPPTKSNPNYTITLGDWLDARGWMSLRCKADGTARVKLKFKNLIPNGVYSLWGLWNTLRPGAVNTRITPVPLGGIPNVMIPDRKGKATFVRELASCPKDVTANGSIMMFIDLAYHSDNNVSGAFPQIGGTPTKFKMADGTVFSSPLVPGAVTHDHILFLISGEKL